jgi:hypothetical protein
MVPKATAHTLKAENFPSGSFLEWWAVIVLGCHVLESVFGRIPDCSIREGSRKINPLLLLTALIHRVP